MTTSSRLDWTIVQKARFFATHNTTGEMLMARTREELNSMINAFDRAANAA